MYHFSPQSRQQKTRQAICYGYRNMNGPSKISSNLHTSQTQPPITPHYPFYRHQHSNHSTYHKHSVQSSNSTFKLQEKTFHGGTGQFCKTTFFGPHIPTTPEDLLANIHRSFPHLSQQFTPPHTIQPPPITITHSQEIHTDRSYPSTNRPIYKRSFLMCRIVLLK